MPWTYKYDLTCLKSKYYISHEYFISYGKRCNLRILTPTGLSSRVLIQWQVLPWEMHREGTMQLEGLIRGLQRQRLEWRSTGQGVLGRHTSTWGDEGQNLPWSHAKVDYPAQATGIGAKMPTSHSRVINGREYLRILSNKWIGDNPFEALMPSHWPPELWKNTLLLFSAIEMLWSFVIATQEK